MSRTRESHPSDGRAVVVGLGNPVLCDDAVGLHVVRRAAQRLEAVGPRVAFTESYAAGFDLLHDLAGFEHALLVDALDAPDKHPGESVVLPVTALAASQGESIAPAGSHVVDLPMLLCAGARLGLVLPKEIVVIGVVAADLTTFTEELSPRVAQRVEQVVSQVVETVEQWLDVVEITA